MWAQKFDNYRKAQKDEVACQNCAHSFAVWYRKGLRCGEAEYNQTVGKTMTCDFAKHKEKATHD